MDIAESEQSLLNVLLKLGEGRLLTFPVSVDMPSGFRLLALRPTQLSGTFIEVQRVMFLSIAIVLLILYCAIITRIASRSVIP